MKRRSFIQKTAAATATAMAAPYILPSGRLFAASGGNFMAGHVVMVCFAGGVRQQEAVLQRYLADSQNVPIEGNILYNLLDGAAPTQKIVYGTDGFLPGDTPIPAILNNPIQKQGVLFREVQASSAGHYGGLNGLISGNTLQTQGLRLKPLVPTIFEYVRKHAGFAATDTWFVGNGIGNSVPLLNYSKHTEYGAAYGANFIAPSVTFGTPGINSYSNAKVYHPEEELSHIYKMKYFLDNTFSNIGGTIDGIHNTEEEKQNIKDFFRHVYLKQQTGDIAFPPVQGADTRMVGYAIEVLKWFKPKLLVLNMSAVDGCHGNFTGYLGAMHRNDHAIGFLWNYIQSQIPDMAGNTTLLVTPECGRNLKPNAIQDQNDWFGYDHSDTNSNRIFTLMAGPQIQAGLSIGSETNPIGYGVDNALTIGDIFGIKNQISAAGYVASHSRSLFDRI